MKRLAKLAGPGGKEEGVLSAFTHNSYSSDFMCEGYVNAGQKRTDRHVKTRRRYAVILRNRPLLLVYDDFSTVRAGQERFVLQLADVDDIIAYASTRSLEFKLYQYSFFVKLDSVKAYERWLYNVQLRMSMVDEELMAAASDALSASAGDQNLAIPYKELHFTSTLGTGGFGSVSKAHYHGTQVAVKFVHEKNKNTSAAAELLRELDVNKNLRHPSIVQLIGITTDGPRVGIVMECAPCGNLDEYIKNKHRFLPTTLMVRLALDIARGMGYLHANGVAHRDLKPANCLLFSLNTESHCLCKVCDFGLSKLMARERISDNTKAVGTVSYMAPEVMASQTYSLSADVYSFATVLFAMVARRQPWHTLKYTDELYDCVVNGKRETVPSQAAPEIRRLIESCWAHDPAARPTFSEVVGYLTGYEKHAMATMRESERTDNAAGISQLLVGRYTAEVSAQHQAMQAMQISERALEESDAPTYVHALASGVDEDEAGDAEGPTSRILRMMAALESPMKRELFDATAASEYNIDKERAAVLGEHLCVEHDLLGDIVPSVRLHRFSEMFPDIVVQPIGGAKVLPCDYSYVSNVLRLLSEPSLYGFYTRIDAETRLGDEAEGYYLLRYSRRPRNFALSVQTRASGNSNVVHFAIEQDSEEGKWKFPNSDRCAMFDSLHALVEYYAETPLPGCHGLKLCAAYAESDGTASGEPPISIRDASLSVREAVAAASSGGDVHATSTEATPTASPSQQSSAKGKKKKKRRREAKAERS